MKLKVIAIVFLLACLGARSALADDSLVAHWQLDEGTGSVAEDDSGFGAAGQIMNGPAWVSGVIGNGLRFDGRDDYIEVGNPASLQLTSSMTIAMWVYAERLTDHPTLISKNGGFGDVGWALSLEDGYPQLKIGQPNATNNKTSTRTSSAAISIGQWHHVAGVFNAGQKLLSLYVDGVQSNGLLNGVTPGSMRNSGWNVNIARRTRYPDVEARRYFKGTLDDIRIYNRALSSQELMALAERQEPPANEAFRQVYEAEQSVLASPLTVSADPAANGGAYISAKTGKSTKSPKREGTLTFSVPADGTYYLWARLNASSGQSDAIYIGIDQSWDRPYARVKNSYQWVAIKTSIGSSEYGFSLSEGEHVFQIGHAEIGARLDALFLTNDSSDVPR
jgi:hypothetical protein